MATGENALAQAATALQIDGGRPLTVDLVAEVEAFNERVEDGHASLVVIRVGGAPTDRGLDQITVNLVRQWERALRRLERLGAATVALAEGDVGGVAMEALLATDHRIATSNVRLLLPASSEAVWPGMLLYRLANQIGVAHVRRAVLFGAPVSAGAAFDLGLVDAVVPDAEAALACVANLTATYSGTELAIRRQLMLDATTTSFEDALGTHLAACDRALRREQRPRAAEVLA